MLFWVNSAPPQCTVNRNRAQKQLRIPACFRNRIPFEKTRKPRISGLSAFKTGFLFLFMKTGTPPAITLSSESVHLPGFGDLGTGRPGIPLFTSGSYRIRDEPSSFGALDTGRSGVPSLHRAHTAFATSLPFREPWYRQAGDSLFYCSRRWISSRQRSSTSLPAHSPCRGRAATSVSNNPPSLKRTRQFTSLPPSLS